MDDTAYLGKAVINGYDTPFGIPDADRLSHLWLIGATGCGKSVLLENLMVHDIEAGNGFCFIDPHGVHAENLLDHIPRERIEDVIYLNVADFEYPVAFNMIGSVPPDSRHLVINDFISTCRHLWGDLWSTSRMEYLTRNTLAALLDTENATLLSVQRMFVDEDYRKEVIKCIRNPSVWTFWEEEFLKIWSPNYRRDAIASVLTKVEQLFSSFITMNILGQSESAFDMGEIMDNKRILIVNLAKGKAGDTEIRFLGSMLISHIFHVALRRDPRTDLAPFSLYVDEFHNFSTNVVSGILSEARKYGLGLTLANQYGEQMDEDTFAAIFGNVGTIAAFRVGQSAAEELEKQFGRKITAEEMVELDNYHVCMKPISGNSFKGETYPPPEPQHFLSDEIIALSRERYGRPRAEVEAEINTTWYPKFPLSLPF